MANPKLNCTKNYRLFLPNPDNRPFDAKKHKRLLNSMKRYGFLSCFPIACFRNGDKHLVVKDGQHRLAFAETLGLPVWWIEEKIDFDVALINCTPKTWVLKDFAEKYALGGKKAYQDGLEFAAVHGLPIGVTFSLLAGTTTFSNIQGQFVDGSFKVKDRAYAELVASIYTSMVDLSQDVRNARFMEACMGVCRVQEFKPSRLIQNAKRCREKLISYSTKDAYLEMLEEIYNFGRHELVGLKAKARMVMRKRFLAARKGQTDK